MSDVGPNNNCGTVGEEVHGKDVYWRCPSRGEHFSRCQYCGSIRPEDLTEDRISGQIVHVDRTVDRKYGYSHKIYVDIKNVRGELSFLSGTTGGDPEDVRARGFTLIEDLTDAEREACEREGVDLSTYAGVTIGVRDVHHAKFYSVHLADSKLDPYTKNQCERIWGYRFDFSGGKVSWSPYDYSVHA